MGCTICHKLRPYSLRHAKLGGAERFEIDSLELVRSVQDGHCPECRLLFDAINTHSTGWQERGRLITVVVGNGEPVRVAIYEEDISKMMFRHDNDAAEDSPVVIGSRPRVPRSSDSHESLRDLKSWYFTCKSSHPQCEQTEQPKLPTRVLNLGNSSSSTDDISVNESGSSQGAYVALSYCWGHSESHPPLKLTRESRDSFRQRLSFASLPLTFQHAVLIARRLRFQYLWIDALCIIQDNEDDWRAEAAKMCDVYSNATITIIASRSDGTSGGLFRDQAFSQVSEVPYRQSSVNVIDENAFRHGGHDPVTRRAWTMQEAMLSNRVILFTSEELRWECNEDRHCQCLEYASAGESDYGDEPHIYRLSRLLRLETMATIETIQGAYTLWNSTVSTYAKRTLTNESDRLLALSGVARRFAERLRPFSIATNNT